MVAATDRSISLHGVIRILAERSDEGSVLEYVYTNDKLFKKPIAISAGASSNSFGQIMAFLTGSIKPQ